MDKEVYFYYYYKSDTSNSYGVDLLNINITDNQYNYFESEKLFQLYPYSAPGMEFIQDKFLVTKENMPTVPRDEKSMKLHNDFSYKTAFLIYIGVI